MRKDEIEKDMENQFFFIIIGNDELVISENLRYLNNLVIPGKMHAEYMIVHENKNLSQALERGRLESAAKYKIYLDQNTFIIDKDFLVKAKQVFEKYQDIAMLGGRGFCKSDGQSKLEIKGHYIYQENNETLPCIKEMGQDASKEILDAMALDKHFMMTSIDTTWKGNDNNYNILKSVELRHRGYRTVVLTDENPMILFDNGILCE